MSYNTIHAIEIDGHPVAEYSVSSLDDPAKAETSETAILATLALAAIRKAKGDDSGMIMLDADLAAEYLERIACGEELTIKELVRYDD